MYVLIDSNIFQGNWHLTSPNFTLFLNFIENQGWTLLIPEVVCEEVNNNQKKDKAKQLDTLKQAYKTLEYLTTVRTRFNKSKYNLPYNLTDSIQNVTYNVTYLPFHQISNKIIVTRAINRVKPFQENEKGFRDTLIWLSLLEYIKEKKIKAPVHIISNNKHDFLNKDGTLLQDLQNDILEYKLLAKIYFYTTLAEFIEKKIPVGSHKKRFQEVVEKYLYPHEDHLSNQIIDYLNEMKIERLRAILLNWKYPDILKGYIIDFNFELFEGSEDIELEDYKELTKSQVYIAGNLNLRRCILSITIPKTFYLTQANSVDSYFHEIEFTDDAAILIRYTRPHLFWSLLFNTKDEKIEELEVNSLDL